MYTDYDLLIRAGRVFCSESGFDGPGAVGVRGDRIVAAGPDVAGTSSETLEFPEALLLPGLVDLHAHPARGESKYGVDPDVEFLPRGVTTVLSQGDAGAVNWTRYRKRVIEGCRTRVRLAINLSSQGESMPGGCFEDLDWVDVNACASAVEDKGEAIWGIAVNVSRIACGNNDPHEVMRRALRAAEGTGLPLLYGLRNPQEWPLAEQLDLLQPGDVLTYLYRSGAWNIVQADGRVHPAIREARRRGVLFDIGHGMSSFVFDVAEAAMADGFPPDTISTDSYARHVSSDPPHDLPRTMSKLLAAGMPEADVFTAVTSRPAAVLGLSDEIGTLTVDSCADLTVLRWNDTALPLVDVEGNQRSGGCWEPIFTVRAGQPVAAAR